MDRRQAIAGRLCLAALALSAVTAAAQQPTFRSSIDLITVDVQVVDRTGAPIPQLTADRFEVQIEGGKRKVVSADVIDEQHGSRGRTYVLGIDVGSINVVESRTLIEGAREFIRRLRPEDTIGVYAFPVGPKFRPTTDHAAILRQLDTIVGSREAIHNTHGLSAVDVIDITAELARGSATQYSDPLPTGRGQQSQGSVSETLDGIVARECGPLDRPCARAVLAEAQGISLILQGQATEALNGLRQMVRALSTVEGRKTLVLLSGGMAVSDRPGGQPDVGELPRLLGKDAAIADTTIYALFLETNFLQLVSVETQRPDRSFGSGRDQAVFGRAMDEFTGASGGAILLLAQGAGTEQFDRVLRETASHYLLAVRPDAIDRDGSLRRLSVKVKGIPRGAVVRSRQWVVVPKAISDGR